MNTIKKHREAVPRVQTNLNLPLATREKIEKWARTHYVTMTDIIVAAIDKYDRNEGSKE